MPGNNDPPLAKDDRQNFPAGYIPSSEPATRKLPGNLPLEPTLNPLTTNVNPDLCAKYHVDSIYRMLTAATAHIIDAKIIFNRMRSKWYRWKYINIDYELGGTYNDLYHPFDAEILAGTNPDAVRGYLQIERALATVRRAHAIASDPKLVHPRFSGRDGLVSNIAKCLKNVHEHLWHLPPSALAPIDRSAPGAGAAEAEYFANITLNLAMSRMLHVDIAMHYWKYKYDSVELTRYPRAFYPHGPRVRPFQDWLREQPYHDAEMALDHHEEKNREQADAKDTAAAENKEKTREPTKDIIGVLGKRKRSLVDEDVEKAEAGRLKMESLRRVPAKKGAARPKQLRKDPLKPKPAGLPGLAHKIKMVPAAGLPTPAMPMRKRINHLVYNYPASPNLGANPQPKPLGRPEPKPLGRPERAEQHDTDPLRLFAHPGPAVMRRGLDHSEQQKSMLKILAYEEKQKRLREVNPVARTPRRGSDDNGGHVSTALQTALDKTMLRITERAAAASRSAHGLVNLISWMWTTLNPADAARFYSQDHQQHREAPVALIEVIPAPIRHVLMPAAPQDSASRTPAQSVSPQLVQALATQLSRRASAPALKSILKTHPRALSVIVRLRRDARRGARAVPHVAFCETAARRDLQALDAGPGGAAAAAAQADDGEDVSRVLFAADEAHSMDLGSGDAMYLGYDDTMDLDSSDAEIDELLWSDMLQLEGAIEEDVWRAHDARLRRIVEVDDETEAEAALAADSGRDGIEATAAQNSSENRSSTWDTDQRMELSRSFTTTTFLIPRNDAAQWHEAAQKQPTVGEDGQWVV